MSTPSVSVGGHENLPVGGHQNAFRVRLAILASPPRLPLLIDQRPCSHDLCTRLLTEHPFRAPDSWRPAVNSRLHTPDGSRWIGAGLF